MPKPKATPAAAKQAREKGIDLTRIKGTGKGGAITVKDLRQAAEVGIGGVRVGRLGDLIPDQNNANQGTPEGEQLLGYSVEQFGIGRGIVVDEDGQIIAGNKTQAAALAALGEDAEVIIVPTRGGQLVVTQRLDLDLEDDPEGRARGLAYTDNRAGERGLSWDPQQIKTDAEDPEIDLKAIFGDRDLRSLIAQTADESDVPTDPGPRVQEAEKLRELWGVESGQVWQLGRHTLVCGDSLDPATIEAALQGRDPWAIFTDPPYGLNYGGARSQVAKQRPYGKIKGDKKAADVGKFVKPLFDLPYEDIWVCASPFNLYPFLAEFVERLGGVDGLITWDKGRPGLGYQHIRRQTEKLIFASNRKKRRGDPSEVDLWYVLVDNPQAYRHGNQKPVALVERALRFSAPAGLVLDPYGGAGSTLIACERRDLTAAIIEIEPNFTAVMIQRWAEMVDGDPVLIE